MSRRCERPGCSAAATVGYGFAATRQLAWLIDLREGSDPHVAGALCERHAAAMQLPRGWWLDDRRTNEPTLFREAHHRPAATAPAGDETDPDAEPPRARRRAPRRSHELVIGEQLALDHAVVPPPPADEADPAVESAVEPGDEPAAGPAPTTDPEPDAEPSPAPVPLRLVVTNDEPDDDVDPAPASGDEPVAAPWMPVFDQSDDLDGLLDASTPLLSRAFGRGGRRSTTGRGDRG